MRYDCIIVGAGASGLMLAAKMKVNKGLIIEGTSAAGSKLLLTGGGRCNLTHAGSIKNFISCYGEAGKSIRKLLYKHSNIEFVDWLNELGLETTTESDKIYPISMKASDVRDLLLARAHENGWVIKYNAKVKDIKSYTELGNDNPAGWLVCANENCLTDKVVIATGGITYPKTGSDGSMFEILEKLGVELAPRKAALSSIEIKDYPYKELAGVSLSDVTVTAYNSDPMITCKGKAARITGDVLFTHTGFSGPAILNISKYAEVGEIIKLSYNKAPSELPKSLRKALEGRSKNDSGDIRNSKLAALLESDDFVVSSIDKNGMVTSGGIALDELDLSTMEIKKLPGIYAIGEAIDVDGMTGGYNLQLCYSTASVVAEN